MTAGDTAWSYTYDANGMRTSRTNGTTTYNYVYNGSQLTQMTVGNDTLYFTYGLLGPTTVTWNGTTYYYSLSGQGDVTGIFNEDGNPVVTYNWDNAWGYNPIPEGVMASTLGELNPLRYRGYVYDQETGYYYLQSRYYDPKIGRFINADVFASTGQGFIGHNMFAYCGNNPVNRADPSGHAFVQVCFDTDGGIQMLGPCMWGGGGGGGGGVAYAASAVSSFPKETVNKFWANVGETIGSTAQACWDAYVHSNELQVQAQYEQDMAVKSFFEDTFRSPARTGDFVALTLSGASTYSAYVGVLAGPTVGGAIWLGASVISLVWSALRYFEVITE